MTDTMTTVETPQAPETAAPETTPAPVETGSLAQALVALQARLPRITKGETAEVETRGGGSYSYSYADLADVSAKLLPVMTSLGLAFNSRPTLHEGRFVLAYTLRHGPSGESEEGFYPLPESGAPQVIGSAITYARRYCLLAVTGAAPEAEDDDGQRAAHTRIGQGAQPQQPAQRAGQRDEPSGPVTPAEMEFVQKAIARIEQATSPDELNEIWASVDAAEERGLTRGAATNLRNRMKIRGNRIDTTFAS